MNILINTEEIGVVFVVCASTIPKILTVLSLGSNHKSVLNLLICILGFCFYYFHFFGKKVQLF